MHRKKCCDRQNETKLEKNKRKKIVNSSMQENSEQFYATSSLTALPMGQPVIYRKPRKESTKEAKIHVSLPWIFVLMLFCFNQDGTWELRRKDQKWDSRRMLPFSTFFFFKPLWLVCCQTQLLTAIFVPSKHLSFFSASFLSQGS